MPKIIERKLIETFKDKEPFTREDLFEFYRHYEPNIKEGTLGWRIYDLKKRNIIMSVKRGTYVISNKPVYEPELSGSAKKLAKLVANRFDDVKYCIWETSCLNRLTRHQFTRSMLLIEIENGFEESLFYELKDSVRNEVFLNPNEKVIDLYVAESNKPIVIKKLLTRAPLSNKTVKNFKINIPTLEKILVDVFSEKKLFYYLQGSELMHIYESALTNYSINFTKLFSYAKRREQKQNIEQFMINHMYYLVKTIIDD